MLVEVQVVSVVVSLSNLGQPDEIQLRSQEKSLIDHFVSKRRNGQRKFQEGDKLGDPPSGPGTLGVLAPEDCSLGQSRTRGCCHHTPGFDEREMLSFWKSFELFFLKSTDRL